MDWIRDWIQDQTAWAARLLTTPLSELTLMEIVGRAVLFLALIGIIAQLFKPPGRN